MICYEQDTIDLMRAGQKQHAPIASFETRREVEGDHNHLSHSQLHAVEQILASRDQVVALEGVAGSGKTTTLAAIRDAAEREGYKVEGLAPTSRAAQTLEETGIRSGTLQRHLAQTEEPQSGNKRLYVLDESSLASTKQMNQFLRRLNREDRVLLVGDTRQHQAVEAGRPYQQLQEAGIETARLDQIVRQKDPALKEVVEQLSCGAVREALDKLEMQGRLNEIVDRDERLTEIAREYAKEPKGTLIVSPDNNSRQQVNEVIHRRMQVEGSVDPQEYKERVLVARQEITGADRRWAAQYETGDTVRYTKGSKTLGLKAGEYARVERAHEKENLLTVRSENGERITYDPRRLHGVTVYRESERALSINDRIQFTAPNQKLRVANRELATIEKIDRNSNLQVRLDSGRAISFNIKENAHLDYGYAVTSHSGQGQTADRVLIHVDTEQGGERLVNQRLAYVAISRGRYDVKVFTNDKHRLAEQLSRNVSHQSALESVGHRIQPLSEVGDAQQKKLTQAHVIAR